MADPIPQINDFKPETRTLLRELEARDCHVIKADNGSTVFLRSAFTTEGAFLDELLASDECRLYVHTPETRASGPSTRTRCIYLVLGNAPGELVCDYHVDPAVRAAVEAASARWDGKVQPTSESPYPTPSERRDIADCEAAGITLFLSPTIKKWQIPAGAAFDRKGVAAHYALGHLPVAKRAELRIKRLGFVTAVQTHNAAPYVQHVLTLRINDCGLLRLLGKLEEL